jgi:hypothetical protein
LPGTITASRHSTHFNSPGIIILALFENGNTMKKLLILLVMMTAVWFAYGQSPTPDPDTLRNPSEQTDPEVKQIPEGIHYIDESVRIATAELPAVVLDSLKKLEPQAWEKSIVYKQKKEDTYKVEIRDGGEERSYRFNKEGKRVKTMDQQQPKKKD